MSETADPKPIAEPAVQPLEDEPKPCPAENVPPAEPLPLPPAAVVFNPGMLDTYFSAFEHAAGGIYHRLLAFEGNVSAWVGSNPALTPLINEAVTFGTDLLAAHGIPVPDIVLAGKSVVAALGKIAASDPTVKSGLAAPAPVWTDPAWRAPA